MLTVDQIKNVSFRKANIGGYRPDEVDKFIDDVVETVEGLKKEKSELVGKMEILMKRIEEYRSDEDSVHNALLSAQKLADQSLKESKKKSEKMMEDAKLEADRIIADANDRIIAEKEQIIKIQQEAADIRQRLIEAYQLQLDALTTLPDQKEVDLAKEDLNARYPTESYSENEPEKAEEEEEEFTSIEDAVEAATADNINEAASEEDDGTIRIEKSAFEKKFGKLKFGDEYDVAAE